ncbi:MAG: polysaccharide deacetylase family protein [Bacteroidota bacterium]
MRTEFTIKIAITAYEPAWELILGQIGVDWSLLPDFTALSPSAYSLIIVNSAVTQSQADTLRQYAHNGGAVLFTPSETDHVQRHSADYKFLRFLPPQKKKEYSFSTVFDLYRKTFIFPDNSLTLSEKFGTGILSYLGVDVTGIINDLRITRKAFIADAARLPNERVARSSKNALRQLIHSHIEYLHHKRNMPFVHTWYFPNGESSIFTFRIDSDKGSQEEIEQIFRLCEEYHIPATWFLDVRSHESWLSYFRKFSRQEIGIHCYHHSVHKSIVLNKENFEKAKTLLERHEIHPEGIAAPTGEWNHYIGTAIRELGLTYSTEFGYDYDNFPSFPPNGSTLSPVLQLPIHPICIGSLLRARFSPDAMTSYFKEVIDAKIALSEPICLYHHPTHDHVEVFKEVFEYIHFRKVSAMSFADYARWWKRRSEHRLTCTIDGTTMNLGGIDDAHIWVRITMPDHTMKVLPVQKGIELTGLSFDAPPAAGGFDQTVTRARKFSFRHSIQDILDWWIKTTE